MDQLCGRIDELKHQAYSAEFTDPVARDIVCEMADCLKALANQVREAQESARSAANAASCLANGIRPD